MKQPHWAQRPHSPTLTIVHLMESLVIARLQTLICCTMDILGAFFQLRMEEAMKQTHPKQMRLDGFLLVGSLVRPS